MGTASLLEWAQEHGGRKRSCAVCALDERPEIDEAIRSGIGPRVICRWLNQEKGKTTITEANVGYHKGAGHAQEGV